MRRGDRSQAVVARSNLHLSRNINRLAVASLKNPAGATFGKRVWRLVSDPCGCDGAISLKLDRVPNQ